jgi:hypothetical protein
VVGGVAHVGTLPSTTSTEFTEFTEFTESNSREQCQSRLCVCAFEGDHVRYYKSGEKCQVCVPHF